MLNQFTEKILRGQQLIRVNLISSEQPVGNKVTHDSFSAHRSAAGKAAEARRDLAAAENVPR
jgi:hypothetical protein